MKKNETLNYPLADFKPDPPAMTVHLHRTPTGYWAYRLGRNLQIDLADRLIDTLCDLAGFEVKFNEIFNGITRKGRFHPRVSGCSALYSCGEFFPDRESIVNLIENAYLPCWCFAIRRIMVNRHPGTSWLKAVQETEKQQNETGKHAQRVLGSLNPYADHVGGRPRRRTG